MGGSQSTRKISVENENAIQVSQEAIDRIQERLAAKQADQPPPPPQYIPPPNYESQQRQKDFAAEEAYWARRIENLKRTHEKINSGMHLEYQKTLKEANELFNLVQEDKIANKLPPCQEEKAKVLECYSTNPNKSLVCSVIVNQFNDCVCKSRIAAVSATS
ncbi:PREDICTED: uncharacterized protein LOC106124082 [Papilio xuthus]|uniref:Uncharacterized protein LOC106124082 n=1 Tax=Papilio xuthus TaxID=66420 RepID=I4DNL1_PAPXU|nr:uncharacterized protein LOC106124082 [Papilio xuthus]KPJ00290.1 hypothetical protein RR46_02678 [Papilio xuthus]BAM19501.1 unknown unsecreted protein [Papilio xuthus]